MIGTLARAISARLRGGLRPAFVPAVIVCAVVLGLGLYADSLNTMVSQQRLRADVLSEVSLIRSKLEGHINSNIQLVRGLVGALAAEPDIDQRRFAALAGTLFNEQSHLRNVAAAPDLVVEMVYPLEGNAAVLGLDYTENPEQRAAALRARDTGQLVLAGPVDLVQGGRGFIGRFPVFREDGSFWGIVSAVVDLDRLYAAAGLLETQNDLVVTLSGRDALGTAGGQFFGDVDLSGLDPIQSEILLPSGSWIISAVPRSGWNAPPENALAFRTLIFVASALTLVSMLLVGRLFEERQRNIAALKQREMELARLTRRFGMALESSRVGVWEFDLVTGELVWDARMNEIYGLPPDDAPRSYAHWRDALHPDDFVRAAEDFRVATEETGSYHSEYRVVTPLGEERNIRAIGAVYDDEGATPRIVGVNWDVSADVALNEALIRAKMLTEARNAELEAAKSRIEHNSLHDSLTGLPNRRYLDDVLRRQAAHCIRTGEGVALLHIDLDRFKQINDTLGHAAGDAMLVHAARVLTDNVREEDFVARIGGDEFVVVCALRDNAVRLEVLADRIIQQMRQPVQYEGHDCRFGVSIGIASVFGAEVDAKKLLVNADIALYRAKSRGRNRFEFFSQALQAEVVNTKRIADDILNGLERNEFFAYYQPQFDARTLDIVGVEALVRWQHPNDGLLSPDAFLTIAEELNVVASIDRLILEQALSHQSRWAAAGLTPPRVSVNVSSRRLHDEGLIPGLRELGFAPGAIAFELVESIYLDDADPIVAWNIDQFTDLGIDIEVDDFGTGYASIVSLLQLKPRRLKIDRQLVMPITQSPAQAQLVGSIIDIGKSLGIGVVAEGVETMEHARMLRELGCDVLQGYAFSRPLSAGDLEQFIAGHQRRKAS